MSATIWIGYREDSYEGCTEPLCAFASKELAEAWKALAKDGTSYVPEIIELPVSQGGGAK